jgi:hypothetical protein
VVLNEAAYSLRAVGRLIEALEPLQAALTMSVNMQAWTMAAAISGNLSQLNLSLGETATAIHDAERGVEFADRSGMPRQQVSKRMTLADARHQAGQRVEALAGAREAEGRQAKGEPQYPMLYSFRGFKYCDLLLSLAEGAAWVGIVSELPQENDIGAALESCRSVRDRARQTLEWIVRYNTPLDVALDHLTIGRTMLYEWILESELAESSDAGFHIAVAVENLRRAGQQDDLPAGLLTRAWWRALTGSLSGPDSAQADLDEAWEIAERGPMRLFLADIHLYRARLFHAVRPYPWSTDADGNPRGPKDDLAAARALIERCGYWRRKGELEDAEQAAETW